MEPSATTVLMACPPRQTWLATRGKLPPPTIAQRDARLASDTRPRLDARSDSKQQPKQTKQLRITSDDAQTAGHRLGN